MFPIRISNEVYTDDSLDFAAFDKNNFKSIVGMAEEDAAARVVRDRILNYEMTWVLLSDPGDVEEFNLQFIRLNLGQIINAGEKLHAMIGKMRDLCFEDPRIGRHQFLDRVRIPMRRYAKEQVAAQIMLQVFSLIENQSHARARHFDLQRFFKQFGSEDGWDQSHRDLVREVEETFDQLTEVFDSDSSPLRNRAITVNVVLLAWQIIRSSKGFDTDKFGQFVREFILRLLWQVSLGADYDRCYSWLLEFQRYVTQASVEKPALAGRARLLEAAWDEWLASESLPGDDEYQQENQKNPHDAASDWKDEG